MNRAIFPGLHRRDTKRRRARAREGKRNTAGEAGRGGKGALHVCAMKVREERKERTEDAAYRFVRAESPARNVRQGERPSGFGRLSRCERAARPDGAAPGESFGGSAFSFHKIW